jgi:hypothetical protein
MKPGFPLADNPSLKVSGPGCAQSWPDYLSLHGRTFWSWVATPMFKPSASARDLTIPMAARTLLTAPRTETLSSLPSFKVRIILNTVVHGHPPINTLVPPLGCDSETIEPVLIAPDGTEYTCSAVEASSSGQQQSSW